MGDDNVLLSSGHPRVNQTGLVALQSTRNLPHCCPHVLSANLNLYELNTRKRISYDLRDYRLAFPRPSLSKMSFDFHAAELAVRLADELVAAGADMIMSILGIHALFGATIAVLWVPVDARSLLTHGRKLPRAPYGRLL